MPGNNLRVAAFKNQLVEAIAAAKALPAGMTLVWAGAPMTGPQLVALLESYQAPILAVELLRAQLAQQEKVRNASLASLRTDLATLKTAVSSQFGNGSPQVAQFGFKPPKARTPLTPAQKVARAAKANATRALRGTMGSRQRQAIKATGDFTVVVTPAPVTGAGSATGASRSTSTGAASSSLVGSQVGAAPSALAPSGPPGTSIASPPLQDVASPPTAS